MTLSQLLALGPDDWEKLSDTELQKALEPFLKVTRPTKAVKPASKSKTVSTKAPSVQQMLMQMQALASQAYKKP